MKIDVIFADRDIIVVNKAAGTLVHRAPGHDEESIADALVKRYPDMAGVGSKERPGVVHRLDMGTSGVMVFARNRNAYLALRRQFESHQTVEKTYLAVVHGRPGRKSGTIDTTVGRDRLSAVTHWLVLGSHDGMSLVEFKIETGRMHQIRIHASEMGCPIVGDATYGDAAKDRRMRRRATHPLLHSVELAFVHPSTGRRVVFSAQPPPDIVYAC
jgi:23S rRNA pseudouridine1911/1915/1917 synthase